MLTTYIISEQKYSVMLHFTNRSPFTNILLLKLYLLLMIQSYVEYIIYYIAVEYIVFFVIASNLFICVVHIIDYFCQNIIQLHEVSILGPLGYEPNTLPLRHRAISMTMSCLIYVCLCVYDKKIFLSSLDSSVGRASD